MTTTNRVSVQRVELASKGQKTIELFAYLMFFLSIVVPFFLWQGGFVVEATVVFLVLFFGCFAMLYLAKVLNWWDRGGLSQNG